MDMLKPISNEFKGMVRTMASLAFVGTAACGLFAVAPANAQETKGSLHLEIEVETTQGAVMVAVYSTAETYNGGKPVAARRVALTDTNMSTVFEGLPYGQYAIKAFHDMDNNGQLTTNPFGAPIEPYAFSNGAKAHYGPPKFEEAAITISTPKLTDKLSFLP